MSLFLLLLAGCEPFDLLELQPDVVVEAPEFAPTPVMPSADCDQDGDGAVRDAAGCRDLAASLDCDDTDSAVYPGAPESCDGRDGDCDGHVDGPDPIDGATLYWDADGDGWGAPGTGFRSCRDDVVGATFIDGDCDDDLDRIHPGAIEVCGDGTDQDCDGLDGDLLEDGVACAWATIEGPSGTLAGAWLGGTGDLTCDGASDLAVAAPHHGDLGQTRLYPGPIAPGEPPYALATLHDPDLGGLSGSVQPLGDVDGDGCDDLALGQGALETGSTVAAWLVFGEASLDDRMLTSGNLTATDITASALTGADDLDGDGRADLLVLAPEQDVAWLVTDLGHGPASLTDSAVTVAPDSTLAALGDTAAVGDLDGDGVPELVLGDARADDGAGHVLVLAVAEGWLSATADDVVAVGNPGARLGAALAIAGDLDGDGLQDLVVGAPDESVSGQDRAGAVRVLRGGDLASGASGTLYGRGSERLGLAVLAPGNLTPETDDRPDLLVASGADGSLYWFPRTDAGGMAVPEQLGPSGLGGAGVTLASGGDLDRDGVDDVLVGMPSEDQVQILVAAQFGR